MNLSGLPERVGRSGGMLHARSEDLSSSTSDPAFYAGLFLRLLVTPRVLLLLWDKWQRWSHSPARCVSPAEFPKSGSMQRAWWGGLRVGRTSWSRSPSSVSLSVGRVVTATPAAKHVRSVHLR